MNFYLKFVVRFMIFIVIITNKIMVMPYFVKLKALHGTYNKTRIRTGSEQILYEYVV